MISFEEAYAIVMKTSGDFGIDDIPLGQGVGRILRESWYADRDMPPYDRITMDGIAIHHGSAIAQRSSIRVEGLAAAGDPKKRLINSANCLEVMTGAIMPEGADTVIRYEDVTIVDGFATINADFRKGQNIHNKGEDRKKGELLLEPGIRLGAPEIGVGASIGKNSIKVSRFPKIMIISTGDELVEIDEVPKAHQIRKSNVYRLSSILQSKGMEVSSQHLIDNLDLITDTLEEILGEYDVIIVSGGVSKGKFDYVPEALESVGVQKLFHKVAQRPGKPFWFGVHDNGTTVFAMPGNPVSSFMCTHVYFLSWLDRCMGLQARKLPYAELQAEVHFPRDLTYFLECKVIHVVDGKLLAFPKKGHGSGDLANLMRGDAFIQIPRGKDIYLKGEIHPVYFYR